MPFRVRRRSQRDGSRWSSLPRHSGGWLGAIHLPSWASPFREAPSGLSRAGPSCARKSQTNVSNLRATALMSFSACSGPLHPGSVTRRARTSRSPAGACTPVVSGHHPDTSTPPRQAVLSHAPLAFGDFPSADGESCVLSRSREREHAPPPKLRDPPGRSNRLPCSPGGSTGGPRCIAASPPIGSIDDLPEIPAGDPRASLTRCDPVAAEPPPCRVASSPRHTARSLSALPTSPARVHSRKVAPPSADRCHPIRRVPPSWFDSHLDGLLRAPDSRILHLVPA